MLGAAQSALIPGQVVAGGYRVEYPLSAGGMGSVYVVTQLNTQRQRALKVMHPQIAQHPKFQERFRQEAQVGAQIHSDHIVEVVDAGVDDATGMPFLAMELLDGADLADTMEKRGPLPTAEVATIYEQLGHALGAAHRANIVHRDLKPENLFLAKSRRADSDWTLKILDFGIAKVVAEAQTASRATQSIGSPLWMAPEQTKTGAQITPQTDIWALGLIAFYLLTGKPFWTAANEETVEQMRLLREIAFEVVPDATARAAQLGVQQRLPNGFDAWFSRCVARAPADRFASIDELVAALLAVLRSSGAAERASAGGIAPAPSSADIATGQFAPELVEQLAPAANIAGQMPDGHAVAPTRADAPAAQVPVTQVPATQVPAAQMPATQVPATQVPATQVPATQVPATQVPAAQVPATQVPMTSSPNSLAGPHAAPMAMAVPAKRESKLPLIAAAMVVLVALGGGAWALMAPDPETLPPPIEDAETVAADTAGPSADVPTELAPDDVPPDDSADTLGDPAPQTNAPVGQPAPKGPWPPAKPLKPSSVRPPNPPPNPQPNPAPTVRPRPRPTPPPPPTNYGKPCRTSANCAPGYSCSYGGKCVPGGSR